MALSLLSSYQNERVTIYPRLASPGAFGEATFGDGISAPARISRSGRMIQLPDGRLRPTLAIVQLVEALASVGDQMSLNAESERLEIVQITEDQDLAGQVVRRSCYLSHP